MIAVVPAQNWVGRWRHASLSGGAVLSCCDLFAACQTLISRGAASTARQGRGWLAGVAFYWGSSWAPASAPPNFPPQSPARRTPKMFPKICPTKFTLRFEYRIVGENVGASFGVRLSRRGPGFCWGGDRCGHMNNSCARVVRFRTSPFGILA